MSKSKFGGFYDTSTKTIKKPKALAEYEPANNEFAPQTWTDISVEESYIVALGDDSKVYTWGRNAGGNLGLNRNWDNDRMSQSIKQISTGYYLSAWIKQDGSLWMVGYNNHGELAQGDAGATHRSSPVQVGTKAWRKVVVGGDHSVAAIDDEGYLYTWGYNIQGSLGVGNNINYSSPIQVGTDKWKDIASAFRAPTGIKDDGSMWCWGWGSNFALGVSSNAHRNSPAQIGTQNHWTEVKAYLHTVYAKQEDGSLWGWGENSAGQLGRGDVAHRNSPVMIYDASFGITDFWPGFVCLFAKGSNNAIWFTGHNGWGEAGIGNTASFSWPLCINESTQFNLTNSTPHDKNYNTILPLHHNVFWEDTDGNQYVTGRNLESEYKTLGIPNETHRSSPVMFPSANSKFDLTKSVNVHGHVPLIAKLDNTLWTWGRNEFGNVGTNYKLNTAADHRSSPTQIRYIIDERSFPTRILPNVNVKSITAGRSHALAIAQDGKLFGWGQRYGVDSNVIEGNPSWVRIATKGGYRDPSPATHIPATIALKSDGTMWGWGFNQFGQLGTNDIQHRSSPTQIGIGRSWIEVGMGRNHSSAIDSEYLLWQWGENSNRQCYSATGDEFDITNKSYVCQIPVPNGMSWTKSATGASFSLALRSDGTIWSVGHNNFGQLGQRDVVGRSSPVQIGSETDWIDVACGDETAYGIRAGAGISYGQLWAWGNNAAGQLGIITVAAQSSPVQVTGATATRYVNAGRSHVMFIDSANRLWGIGRNDFGQLGIGSGVFQSSPVQVASGITFDSVYCGDIHTIALAANSKMLVWGNNDGGELGFNENWGDLSNRTHPTLVGWNGDGSEGKHPNHYTSWKQVARGQYTSHTVAIRSDGTMWSWGMNTFGQLGHGNAIWKSSPTQIGSNSGWVKAATGTNHSAAINSSGQLFTWGLNSTGQLGVNNTVTTSSPVQVSGTLWSDVTCGHETTGGIRNGLGYVWGLGSSGELGQSNVLNYSSPVVINSGSSVSIVQLGYQHMGFIDGAGKLFMTGRNDWGQVGNQIGNSVQSKSSPVQVAHYSTNGSGPTQVLSNYWTTQWFHPGDTPEVWGCGYNGFGQMGDGTTIGRSSPIQVDTGVGGYIPFNVSVATPYLSSSSTINSRFHSMAFIEDGKLYTMGQNQVGQLGLGNVINGYSSPQQVGAGTDWSQVMRGGNDGYYNGAIKTDGTLWVWGNNTHGELGVNNRTNYSSPVQVGAETDWVSVWGGGSPTSITLGVRDTGVRQEIYTWGYNSHGNLGDITTVHRSSPVLIGHSEDGYGSWVQIAVGKNHVLATREFGLGLWAWGLNNYGQLTDGTTIWKSSPTQIGSESWRMIAAQDHFSILLKDSSELWGCGYNGTSVSAFGGVGTLSIIDQVRLRPIYFMDQAEQRLYCDVKFLSSGGTRHTHMIVNYTGGYEPVNIAYSWGFNDWGYLGTSEGNRLNVSSPVQVMRERRFRDLPLGHIYSVAIENNVVGPNGISRDRQAWAWGYNANGELGVEDHCGFLWSVSQPVQIGRRFEKTDTWLSSGFTKDPWSRHNIGIKHTSNDLIYRPYNYNLFTWGEGGRGEIGNGFVVNQSSPVQIITGTGINVSEQWKKVAKGYFYTLAIKQDNTLWAWGQNSIGQLGIRNTVQQNSPVQVGGLSDWAQISCGRSHTIAIKTDGTLWAWGKNTEGQLGIGTITAPNNNISSPVQVGSDDDWEQIAGGALNSFGIRTGGALYGWGWAADGQLGQTDRVYKSSPVQIMADKSIVQVQAAYVTMARDSNNYVWVWGYNSNGQLGLGHLFHRSSPVQLSTSRQFRDIYAGELNCAAIDTDYKMWVWGYNTNGELGQGNTVHRSSPVQLGMKYVTDPSTTIYDEQYIMAGVSWTQVFGNNYTMFGLDHNNKLWAWGYGGIGELGHNVGNDKSRSSPVQIGIEQFSHIFCGTNTQYQIRTDGTMWGSGWAGQGQFGIERVSPAFLGHFSPIPIMSSRLYPAQANLSWTTVGGGLHWNSSIASDGRLYAAGWHNTGQLGVLSNNNTTGLNIPRLVHSDKSWTMVAPSVNHTLALRTDGTLWVWGVNTVGARGQGDVLNRGYSPTQLGTRNDWVGVLGGNSHSMAANSTALFMWGQNTNGECGYGERHLLPPGNTAYRSSPTQISSREPIGRLWFTTANFKNSKSTGANYHNGLITANNELFRWGYNNWGQLGNPVNSVNVHRSSPVLVQSYQRFDANNTPMRLSWTMVRGGWYNTYAIDKDQRLWAWGDDSYGQLGQMWGPANYGNIYTGLGVAAMFASSPVQIGAIDENFDLQFLDPNDINNGFVSRIRKNESWVMVNGAVQYTGAINSNNDLYTFGYNVYGHLGHGNTTSKSSPTQLGADKKWYWIDANHHQMGGIANTGELWMWGYNVQGQIGDGTTVQRNSPVRIGSDKTWESVHMGWYHTVARTSDGGLWTWGENSLGTLGHNNAISKSSPVQVGTLSWKGILDANTKAVGYIGNNYQTYGIRDGDGQDGRLFAWGLNDATRSLGINDWPQNIAGNQSSPVQVGVLDLSQEFVYNNGASQGTALGVTYPRQIGNLNYDSVDAGKDFTIAISSNEKLYTWGKTTSGKLGHGKLAENEYFSPVQINTNSDNFGTAIAGEDTGFALKK